MATVADIREDGENKTFTMRSEIAEELRIDQSISHNGVCLTVESIANDTYTKHSSNPTSACSGRATG